MAMPRKLTNEQLKKLKELWNEGYSRTELAARFNCSVSCVGYMIRNGDKKLSNLVSLNNRKFDYLVGESSDIARIFYYLDRSKEYIDVLKNKVCKRFPDYAEYFDNFYETCFQDTENLKVLLKEHLKPDWGYVEKDCRKRWREYEKEHRRLTGRSSKNFLDK